MKYHKTCPCCGVITTAYSIKLSNVMVDAFIKFATKSKAMNVGLKKGDIGLSNSQYSNFQNLRYFGLITMLGGQWFLTSIGSLWFRGEISIRDTAGFMGGKILGIDHEAWITHDAKIKNVYIDSYIQEFQDTREKYQAEKTKAVVVY